MKPDPQSLVLALLTIGLGVAALILTTGWFLPILILAGGLVGLFTALRPAQRDEAGEAP
ncbi:hypothetical protein IU501_12620 [Nocardia otitidiscaviarum]|uniref:hypothetical protein n=1 Tax=Nocardia otitidiscaviarum TaxID=1823 RepID=UPI000AD53499|nr:hypothetical protein [Nocardia otitidiscaviarum]MBF6133842.1 hypothetical protein [Nocardia otitidiscaviarum]MBF6487870.1 hypothetical protein [Nocardia otitidiscaviarum]